jgi:hypothetical protein
MWPKAVSNGNPLRFRLGRPVLVDELRLVDDLLGYFFRKQPHAKREPLSDINTAVMDRLTELDPKRSIRLSMAPAEKQFRCFAVRLHRKPLAGFGETASGCIR